MAETKLRTGKLYIPGLNGLRAISIMLVFLNHFRLSNYSPIHNLPQPWIFFTNGGLGVNIFFVISGYLITVLLMRERELIQTISLKKFYSRRALRIFPAYYFLLLCYFVLQLMHILHLPLISWITSLTYTRYFYKTEWSTGHLWSLSVEEHFYLLWPLLFKLRKNTKYNFLFVVVLLVPVVRVLYDLVFHYKWMDTQSFFERADAIICGCILALHFEKISAIVNKLVEKSRLFFFLPLVVLFLLYLASNLDNLPQPLSILATAFGGTFGTIANIAIVFLVVVSINYKTAWSKFLNLRPMNFIGKISYSIYLWQEIFLSDSSRKYVPFPLNICCIILMALFSYYVIEKPFLKIKTKYEVA